MNCPPVIDALFKATSLPLISGGAHSGNIAKVGVKHQSINEKTHEYRSLYIN
jgi:hypothetical protein